MDYYYTTIYQFECISDSNLTKDKVIYKDDTDGVTVILTNDINRHCYKHDVKLAVITLLMHGRVNFYNKIELQTLPKKIDTEVQNIQNKRTLEANEKKNAYIVILIKGSQDLDACQEKCMETEQFRFCFDAFDDNVIKEDCKEKIFSITTAISFIVGPEYYIENIFSGIYFIDKNGKLLYNTTLHFNPVRTCVSNPVDVRKEARATELIDVCTHDLQFKTIYRLFDQSLEEKRDRLRSFVYAWHALEIFTNKAFCIYERKFIDDIACKYNLQVVDQFLGRVRSVMKDRYRLTDKFLLVALFLGDEVDSDMELFKNIKRLRDDIFHGKEFSEKDLPVEDVRKLVAKYLKEALTR